MDTPAPTDVRSIIQSVILPADDRFQFCLETIQEWQPTDKFFSLRRSPFTKRFLLRCLTTWKKVQEGRVPFPATQSLPEQLIRDEELLNTWDFACHQELGEAIVSAGFFRKPPSELVRLFACRLFHPDAIMRCAALNFLVYTPAIGCLMGDMWDFFVEPFISSTLRLMITQPIFFPIKSIDGQRWAAQRYLQMHGHDTPLEIRELAETDNAIPSEIETELSPDAKTEPRIASERLDLFAKLFEKHVELFDTYLGAALADITLLPTYFWKFPNQDCEAMVTDVMMLRCHYPDQMAPDRRLSDLQIDFFTDSPLARRMLAYHSGRIASPTHPRDELVHDTKARIVERLAEGRPLNFRYCSYPVGLGYLRAVIRDKMLVSVRKPKQPHRRPILLPDFDDHPSWRVYSTDIDSEMDLLAAAERSLTPDCRDMLNQLSAFEKALILRCGILDETYDEAAEHLANDLRFVEHFRRGQPYNVVRIQFPSACRKLEALYKR